MRRMFKGISAIVLSAVLLAMTAVTAFASSAKTGDSIEVRVSVEGEDSMGSMTVQINYDKDKLDLLSDETLNGTGLSNKTTVGELIWGAIFDPEGSDYTNKTDVYSVIFIAKQDISDVESLITCTVNDAYKIGDSGVTPADASHVSFSLMLENEDITQSVSSQSDNTSKTEVTSKSNNTTDKSTAQTSSQTISSRSDTTSSKVSSKTSSAESSKADTKSKAAASSSKSESKSKESSDKEKVTELDKDTESIVESTVSLTETFDEADFESVPPIKLDTGTTSTADSRGTFPKGAVIGIAACLVIAAAGIITIAVKKKG